jgi:hypothetical protein
MAEIRAFPQRRTQDKFARFEAAINDPALPADQIWETYRELAEAHLSDLVGVTRARRIATDAVEDAKTYAYELGRRGASKEEIPKAFVSRLFCRMRKELGLPEDLPDA